MRRSVHAASAMQALREARKHVNGAAMDAGDSAWICFAEELRLAHLGWVGSRAVSADD